MRRGERLRLLEGGPGERRRLGPGVIGIRAKRSGARQAEATLAFEPVCRRAPESNSKNKRATGAHCSRRFEKVREGSRKFEKVREGSRKFEKVQEGSRRFEKVQEGYVLQLVTAFY